MAALRMQVEASTGLGRAVRQQLRRLCAASSRTLPQLAQLGRSEAYSRCCRHSLHLLG